LCDTAPFTTASINYEAVQSFSPILKIDFICIFLKQTPWAFSVWSFSKDLSKYGLGCIALKVIFQGTKCQILFSSTHVLYENQIKDIKAKVM
jgi:hypothetical protein